MYVAVVLKVYDDNKDVSKSHGWLYCLTAAGTFGRWASPRLLVLAQLSPRHLRLSKCVESHPTCCNYLFNVQNIIFESFVIIR